MHYTTNREIGEQESIKLLTNELRCFASEGKAIDKWLRAGVMEGEEIEYPEDGCPQGGVVSLMVSNRYLHEVMDKWYDEDILPSSVDLRAGLCDFPDRVSNPSLDVDHYSQRGNRQAQ